MNNILLDALSLVLLACAAYYDKKRLLIPNIVCLSLSVLALIKAYITGTIIQAFIVGFGFLIVLLFLAVKCTGLGGGDVKLLSAVAVYYGFAQALFITAISCIFALIHIKKLKIKSTYLAPFVFVGASVMCFFNYII